MPRERSPAALLAELDALPLLCPTPGGWADLAAANLPVFLADHAVCEQQAALSALNLVAHYPEDADLIDRMSSLAAEEVMHFRRVSQLLHGRGLQPARRRPNPYVQALREQVRLERAAELKLDRLLVGALIEARSCERFTRLLVAVTDRDAEVAELLFDLGPAEKRHWEMFFALASREPEQPGLDDRWRFWLALDRDLTLAAGMKPTVHG